MSDAGQCIFDPGLEMSSTHGKDCFCSRKFAFSLHFLNTYSPNNNFTLFSDRLHLKTAFIHAFIIHSFILQNVLDTSYKPVTLLGT